ncbi:MAG: hypothetical protein ACE5H2_05980 [Terriglobia bacterium]
MAALALMLLPLPGLCQEPFTLTERCNAVECSEGPEWTATAETGEQDLAWQAA